MGFYGNARTSSVAGEKSSFRNGILRNRLKSPWMIDGEKNIPSPPQKSLRFPLTRCCFHYLFLMQICPNHGNIHQLSEESALSVSFIHFTPPLIPCDGCFKSSNVESESKTFIDFMFYDKVMLIMLNFYSASRGKSVSQPRTLGSDFIASVVKTQYHLRCRFLISSSPTILIANKFTRRFKGMPSEDIMGKVGIASPTPKKNQTVSRVLDDKYLITHFHRPPTKPPLLYASISITIFVLWRVNVIC